MSTLQRVLGIKIDVAGHGQAAKAVESVGTAIDHVSESNTNLAKSSNAGATGINQVSEGFKKTNPAIDSHNAKINAATLSAKQYTAAMRMVPAQLTDIVVSLQGGQAPLTVLLQQGGQLKDMFGGIGPAAKAMGSYVMALVTPFSVATAGVLALGGAYYAGWKEQEQMRNSLIATGYAAGMSVAQLAGHAQEVGRITGSYGDAKDAAQVLASTGMFTGATLVAAMEGVTASVKVNGGAVEDAAKEYAMLAADPLRNLERLNQQYHFLTASVYQHIKSLEDQGDTQGAVKLAVETFSQAHKERMEEMRGQVGWLEGGWDAFTKQISRAKNAILDIGKDATLNELQESYDNILAQVERARSVRTISNIGRLPSLERDLAAAKVELDRALAEAGKAEDRAKKAQAEEDKIKQLKNYDSYTSAISRMSISQGLTKQLDDEAKAFEAATKGVAKNSEEYTRAEGLYQNAVNNIRERAAAQQRQADGTNKITQSYDALITKSQDLIASMQYEQSEGEKLNQGQKTVLDIRELLATSTGRLTSNQRELLETYAAQITAIEATSQAEAAKAERNRIFAEEQKAQLLAQREYESSLLAATQSVDKLVENAQKEAQAIKQQVDMLQLGAAAVNRLEQSRLLDAAAAYDQAVAMMKLNQESPAAIAFVEKQAASLRDLAAARQQAFGSQTTLDGIKKAKEAQDDLVQKSIRDHESINRSLTDALLRGFESGKTPAENLRDTVENMFNTLVLRPIIQAVVSPVSDILGQVFSGGGSMASISGAGGNGGSTSSNWMGAAKSLWDAKQGNSMSQNLMGTVGGWLGNISTMVGSQSIGQFASGVAGKMVGSAAGMGPTVAGSSTGIGAMSSGWGAAGAFAAKAMPWVGAAVQALSGDVKGAAWTAAGAAIGSVIPGIGTAIGAVIGSLIGGIVGKKAPKQYGSTASTSWVDGAVASSSTGNIGRSLGVSSGLGGLNEAFSASLGGLLSDFGLSDQIDTSSNMSARTNVRGGFNASFDGGSVNYGTKFGKTKRVDLNQAFQQMIDTVMGSVLSEAIQKSKLPEGIRALFDGIADKTKVAEMINASLALNGAQEQLADRFGLTVDAAAKVSKQTGYTGDDLTKFVNELAATANAFKSQGQQLIEARDDLTAYVKEYGNAAALPSTLDAFDSLLKSIDTTTQEGIEKFTALFGIRTGFTEFTKAMDTLKANVDTSIYSMLTPSEQLAKNQETLAKQFGELNLAVPGSIDELIRMGTGIDYTTEAGLNLAAAFPALVQGFMSIHDQTEQLANSMNSFDSDKFQSLFDWQMYRGVATNSSLDKANALLGVPGFASGGSHSGGWRVVGENGPELEYTGPSKIFSNEQSARMLASGQNADIRSLLQINQEMKMALEAIIKHASRSADQLEDWDSFGMPEERELSA